MIVWNCWMVGGAMLYEPLLTTALGCRSARRTSAKARCPIRSTAMRARQSSWKSSTRCSMRTIPRLRARYRSTGLVDIVSLHGLGQPDQEDLLLNGLLPELRRRGLIDTEYRGGDLRSNLELPPL